MDLARMFGGPSILGQQLGLQQFDQEQQTSQINNANTLQQMFQNHQMNPLKVDHQRLMNEQLPVQTEGMRIGNKQQQLKYDEDSQLSASNVANKLRGNEVDMEKHNLNMFMTQLERGMVDPNPRIRAMSKELYEQSGAFVKSQFDENVKTNGKIREIDATGRNQRQNTQMVIDAGGYQRGGAGSKGLSGDLATDVEAILSKQKKAHERYGTLNDAAMRAEIAGDMEAAANYRRRAEVLRPQAEAELRNSAAPGTADLQEMGINVNPNRNIAPQNGNTPAPAAPQAKPITATHPQTGQRIMSTDGGKTWQPYKGN